MSTHLHCLDGTNFDVSMQCQYGEPLAPSVVSYVLLIYNIFCFNDGAFVINLGIKKNRTVNEKHLRTDLVQGY
jgi:hypothetical protein